MGHGKSKAPEIPRHVFFDYPLGRDLLESIQANNFAQNGTINRPAAPPPRALGQLEKSVRTPILASSLQSVARSREGLAAEVERYNAQRREARRHEARSILPTYSSTPRSDSISHSDKSNCISLKFVFFLVMIAVFLTIAWWQCQLSVCK